MSNKMNYGTRFGPGSVAGGRIGFSPIAHPYFTRPTDPLKLVFHQMRQEAANRMRPRKPEPDPHELADRLRTNIAMLTLVRAQGGTDAYYIGKHIEALQRRLARIGGS